MTSGMEAQNDAGLVVWHKTEQGWVGQVLHVQGQVVAGHDMSDELDSLSTLETGFTKI